MSISENLVCWLANNSSQKFMVESEYAGKKYLIIFGVHDYDFPRNAEMDLGITDETRKPIFYSTRFKCPATMKELYSKIIGIFEEYIKKTGCFDGNRTLYY